MSLVAITLDNLCNMPTQQFEYKGYAVWKKKCCKVKHVHMSGQQLYSKTLGMLKMNEIF